jgi:hypothetical protein
MAFIGNQPAESFTSFATQEFSTSATTSYTLDHAVTNENEIALFINNVRQQPGSGKAYTASGTALTLSAATASTDTMYCVFLGRALQTVTPATNSITTAMISDDAVTAAKATGFGKIAQVLSTTKTDTTSVSQSSSFADITGMSVSITPSATSSKILVICSANVATNTGYNLHLRLVRDSTAICIGDAAGSRSRVSMGIRPASTYDRIERSMNFLDSPSSTSAIAYKLQWRQVDNTTAYLNRTHDDSDDEHRPRLASTITVMEVLA